jgi:hypothetical protein
MEHMVLHYKVLLLCDASYNLEIKSKWISSFYCTST